MTAFLGFSGRLTPDSVQGVSFPPAKLGRRGLDERHVRAFCGQVERELVRLLNERTSLSSEVQRLRNRVLGGEGAEARILQDDAQAQAVHILSTAQQTADRYVADAQAYSSRITEEARLRRDHIMSEAQQHSDMIMEEAHSRARDAAVTALNLPAPVQTDQERQAAQAELAYLRTYSDVYRAHLRAYTEGVLRGIEEWERKEATTFQATAQEQQNGLNGLNGHRSIGP